MSAVDNLKQAVVDVQAENQLVISALGGVSGQLTDLNKQIADLKAALLASGSTDADVQAAADALESGLTSVKAAVDAVVPPTPVA